MEEFNEEVLQELLPLEVFSGPLSNNVIEFKTIVPQPDEFGRRRTDHLSWAAVVRSSIKTKAEAEDWVKRFGENTDTQWIVKSSVKCTGKILICRKTYVCQHSDWNKAKESDNNRHRNYNCMATIKMRVFHATSRSYDQSKRWFPAEFEIFNAHSHSIGSRESLSFLRADETVKEKYKYYFNDLGMTLKEAMVHHEEELLREYGFPRDSPEFAKILADSSKNPRERIVRYIHDNERKKRGETPRPRKKPYSAGSEPKVKKFKRGPVLSRQKLKPMERIVMVQGPAGQQPIKILEEYDESGEYADLPGYEGAYYDETGAFVDQDGAYHPAALVYEEYQGDDDTEQGSSTQLPRTQAVDGEVEIEYRESAEELKGEGESHGGAVYEKVVNQRGQAQLRTVTAPVQFVEYTKNQCIEAFTALVDWFGTENSVDAMRSFMHTMRQIRNETQFAGFLNGRVRKRKEIALAELMESASASTGICFRETGSVERVTAGHIGKDDTPLE